MKEYLVTPPILTQLKPRELLYIYVAASNRAISLVLVKKERSEQKAIYLTTQTLQRDETRYERVEKQTLALASLARELKP